MARAPIIFLLGTLELGLINCVAPPVQTPRGASLPPRKLKISRSSLRTTVRPSTVLETTEKDGSVNKKGFRCMWTISILVFRYAVKRLSLYIYSSEHTCLKCRTRSSRFAAVSYCSVMDPRTAFSRHPAFIRNPAAPHKIMSTWNDFEAKTCRFEISSNCVERCTFDLSFCSFL